MMNQTLTRTEIFPPSLKQSFGVFAGSLLLALIAAVLFGSMAVNAFGEKAAWYLVRSSGTVGYLLLAGSTIWGLVLSTQVAKKLVPAAPALAILSSPTTCCNPGCTCRTTR